MSGARRGMIAQEFAIDKRRSGDRRSPPFDRHFATYDYRQRDEVTLGRTTPILRIFDEAKAREFYVDFLGFKINWEHRFEPGLPLYMQVSKDECILHLSEHFGDGSPGVHVRIDIEGVDEFQQQLL